MSINISRKLLTGTGIFTGCMAGYFTGIRLIERDAYNGKQVPYEDKIIPELLNSANRLDLKTKHGLEFSAMDINPNNSRKYLIYCNGLFGSMCLRKQKTYAELLKTNYGIIGFNYPGWGDEKNKFSQKNAQESITSVYNYLTQKGIKPENIGVVAHSMGCAVASEFAAHNKIAFVVLVSPFNKARDEVKYYIDKTNLKPFQKQIMKYLPSRILPLKFTLNNEKNLKKAECPVLILASEDDNVVPIELTRKLKNKLSEKNNIQYQEFKTGAHNIIGEKLDKGIEFITNMKF